MDKKFIERSKLNLSDVNKEVLEQWKEEDLFHRSITEREGCPSFIFFEPPAGLCSIMESTGISSL